MLEKFNPVELVMNGIKKLFSGIGNFIASIFNVELIKEKISKAFDIIGKIINIFKGLTKGGLAAVGAAFPGGESPKEAFIRVYQETVAGSNPSVEAEGSSPGMDRAMGEDAIQAEYQAEKDAEFGPAKELKQNADGTYSENFEQKTSTSDTITKNPVGLALMSMTDDEFLQYNSADKKGKKILLARKIEELNLKKNDPKLESAYDKIQAKKDDMLLSPEARRAKYEAKFEAKSNAFLEKKNNERAQFMDPSKFNFSPFGISKAQFKEDDKKPGLLSSIVSMFTGGSSDVDNSKLVADQKKSSATVTNITNNNINQNTDNSVSNSAMVNKVSIDHNDPTSSFLSGSAAVAEY
jgi:hypothetical protein